MEDFVRWYSPRDWIPSDDLSPTSSEGGRDVAEVGVAGEGVAGEGVAEEGDPKDLEDVGGRADGDENVTAVATEEGKGEWSQEGWAQEGDWGQEDWDVVGGANTTSNSTTEDGMVKRVRVNPVSSFLINPFCS